MVLVFDGKYHGEGDATLVIRGGDSVLPETGVSLRGSPTDARIVQFNDVPALEAALEPRDVALVLAEPAMTNAGFILPEPGYHEALRAATRETGTLLALDEIHTLVCSYAGLSVDGIWNRTSSHWGSRSPPASRSPPMGCARRSPR